MSVARKALLALSTNAWLRDHATRTAFVRRSVSTFMPGERFEDAMGASAAQQAQGIGTIFTKLGENLTRLDEAEEVTHHYLDALDKIQAAGLDAQISVKPTQLGLDLDNACDRLMFKLDRLWLRRTSDNLYAHLPALRNFNRLRTVWLVRLERCSRDGQLQLNRRLNLLD